MYITQTTKSLCAYLSAGIVLGHEKISSGPLFSGSGNRRWNEWRTVFQSLLMSYDEAATLQDRFTHAREGVVEMFSHQRRPGRSYPGFVRARRRLTARIEAPLQCHLRKQHQPMAGSSWRRNGWIPFAADGSRVEMPRTEANEKAFGCAGRDRTGPQLQLTVLYHLGTGLPWAWQSGPGTDAERHHLRAMLTTLPENTLLVLDAGFTGYELMCELNRRGIRFLIRAGANMTFLRDLVLEVKSEPERVWLWPQAYRHQPPLGLRLIRRQARSSETGVLESMCLVTNVMDPQALSDEQAGEFFRDRWGVEVCFRNFKQTMAHHKLRSRAPRQVQDELYWAMVAYVLLGLMSVNALRRTNHDPRQLSVAEGLRTVREALRTRKPWRRRSEWDLRLAAARKDTYVRTRPKRARDWPHKKHESPPGLPNIRTATAKEKACAKRVCHAA